MKPPLVTICIPTYNHEQFLPETLASVNAQTYENIEVLVLDDCSTDGSAAIAHCFALTDQRYRVHVNEHNLGMVANWNRCLQLAQGEYIKYLFGDDLLATPDAIKKMVAALQGSPAAGLVATARIIVDEQSREIDRLCHFPDGFTADGEEVIRRCLRRITREHNLIGEPSAVMFRKELAQRGFDLRYRQLVDLEMWFHLLEQGRFVYLAEPLCSFRHHAGQQTKKNALELTFVDDLTCLFADYLSKPYVKIGRTARAYLLYYQFYKLMKHARQGQHDISLVREKIEKLYGQWRFYLMRPFYRLYTPYWQLKRFFAKVAGRE